MTNTLVNGIGWACLVVVVFLIYLEVVKIEESFTGVTNKIS